jgi:Ecdysteroid kinase-like family
MPRKAQDSFASILPPDCKVHSHTLLANLWSNYGHIWRLSLSSPGETPHSAILKLIQPPPSSGSASESHLRKLISYRVERYFYSRLSGNLTTLSPVAKSFAVAESAKDEALLLEDLSVNFPIPAPYSLSEAKTHAVLKWLGNFHAAFWNVEDISVIPAPMAVEKPDQVDGVWEQGGYWYLETRSEEFESLRDQADDYAWLLPYCEAVATKLKHQASLHGSGRTLVHGDCKAANIIFSGTEESCALYDFQYVGVGLGVKDLVYFLGTSADRRQIIGPGENKLLRYYYDELMDALGRRGIDGSGYTWETLIMQWEWALVDWMRFMAGWGCWGNSEWVERRAKAICKRWNEDGSSFVSL